MRRYSPRTFVNVAKVTVTGITQGLIEPSGIRNFDVIFPSIRYESSRCV